MADLKALKQSVAEKTDVKESATTLVHGVADALDGLTHDPVAIKALADDMRHVADELGQAVLDNTQHGQQHAQAKPIEPAPAHPHPAKSPRTK